MAAVDENFHSDFVFHSAPPGIGSDREAFKQLVALFRGAFPDQRVEFEDQIAENGRVASRVRIRGTHQGELNGIPATGKTVEISGFNIVRIAGGKITDVWGLSDQAAMLRQIGAIPS